MNLQASLNEERRSSPFLSSTEMFKSAGTILSFFPAISSRPLKLTIREFEKRLKFLIISQAYKKVGLCFSYNDENILFNPQSLYQLNLSTKHHPHLSLITLMCGQGCKWEANRRGIKRPSLLILDLRDEICRILKTKRKVRSSMGCRFLEWMMISQIGFVNWVVILGQGGG